MKHIKRFRLGVELLEDRCVPTNSVTLTGGVLNIVGDARQAHVGLVVQQTAGVTQVVLDGATSTFTDAVTQINYQGGKSNNLFSNLTNVAGTLSFGNGDNVVYSRAAGETITVGNGTNYIQDLAGASTIVAGKGANNIFGGPGDHITVGSGHDIIYDLFGANTITVAPHSHTDYIFTNATSTVTGVGRNDRVAVFFAANRQIGSGTLVLENGVLYFTANDKGDQFVLNRVGNRIVATYNLNDGTGFHTQTFNQADVKLVANFGGAGNDVFVNNTHVPDVQYGAGGTNTLVGGFGILDVENAGTDSSSSVVVGRSPVDNDVTGSASAGATTVLMVNPRAARNVVRSNNPADQVFGYDNGHNGGHDIFFSPFGLGHKKLKTPPLPPAPPPPPPPPPTTPPPTPPRQA